MIRAEKAEADRAVLVEALELSVKAFEDNLAYTMRKNESIMADALIAARYALASVKEEAPCPKN